MYNQGSLLDVHAQLTFNVSDTLASIVDAGYQPENGSQYPDTRFGEGLKQVAQLIKAEVGLEVTAVYIGGWDTHAAQGLSQALCQICSLISLEVSQPFTRI